MLIRRKLCVRVYNHISLHLYLPLVFSFNWKLLLFFTSHNSNSLRQQVSPEAVLYRSYYNNIFSRLNNIYIIIYTTSSARNAIKCNVSLLASNLSSLSGPGTDWLGCWDTTSCFPKMCITVHTTHKRKILTVDLKLCTQVPCIQYRPPLRNDFSKFVPRRIHSDTCCFVF